MIQCFGLNIKLSKMILVHCCQLRNCRHCNYDVISTDKHNCADLV